MFFLFEYLGQIGWRINVPILNILKTAYNHKMTVGDLPGSDIALPSKEECVRIVTKRIYKNTYIFKNQKNKKNSEENNDSSSSSSSSSSSVSSSSSLDETDLSNWGNEELLKNIKSLGNVDDEELDPLIPRFDEKYYKDYCKRITMKNAATHSSRCDLHLKIWVADKFQDEVFYYPHNLDFRGRAYPVPPNLNHLGKVICRRRSLILYYTIIYITARNYTTLQHPTRCNDMISCDILQYIVMSYNIAIIQYNVLSCNII